LQARGLPGGHGNFDIGYHVGAGFEYRVFRGLSLGWDFRYNRIASAPGSLKTQGTRIGVHF
jgi:opacity protein-like surface antigen